MKTDSRRPILYNGEAYSKPITKGGGGLSKQPAITFEKARENIIKDIDSTTQSIKSISPEYRLPHELIMCVRLHQDFSAKSHYPLTLFDSTDNQNGLKEIGSRIWRSKDEKTSNESEGKLLFVRTTENDLTKFKERLYKSESHTTRGKQFQLDVRKISKINLLSATEQILGFDEQWTNGRIEAVIHPLGIDKEKAFGQFKKIIAEAGANLDSLQYKQYGGGLTFISVLANTNIVKALSGYYPLRTIHPLIARELPIITRDTSIKGAPIPPIFKVKSNIVVGVLDGGYKQGNSYLDNYVESLDSVSEPAMEKYLVHGTQVTSAALYGALNNYKNTDQLPEPPISVKNFRVLSETGSDPDLYKAIDAIELIVPNNKNIKVFNLSIGPRGPILDDHISRFTFACDLLRKQHEVLFCVAVGNDGNIDGYDRIQAPSDIVNGMAIGSYSIANGMKERASYSCVGPGREGNKLKPDITAFGGCDRIPIHLVSHQNGFRSYTSGTSFASPLVASPTAQLIGGSKNTINSLVARALLIHSTIETSKRSHCMEMGHGTLPDNIQDIVNCPTKSYTLIYQGEIKPGSYVEYAIPWPNEIVLGKINFRWTMAVLTNVDPLSPDDYTTTTIETAFYPNSKKFTFSKEGEKPIKVDIETESTKAGKLLKDGWKQSEFPVADPKANPFTPEYKLRADLKWDSIDSRKKSKRTGVKAPIFHVHALKRGHRYNAEKVKFALILSVEAPSSNIDLYSKILAKYSVLTPLKVDIKATIPVNAQ